ncbi:alpha/beta hydrolase [Pararhodonellum marinum]|uniref:hypothetical protein n=1 Tax=Pararhodonellum marinum TaxID=2755358 RepID=UPI001E30D120|nr:hypothetical protein [Pararhodonellum marinum]
MKIYFLFLVFCFGAFWLLEVKAQSFSSSIPDQPDSNIRYLFYLHGGIVQEQGPNAVSPYYGEYAYQAILDTLVGRGFHVVSEVRPKDTDEKVYAVKLNNQIDTLIQQGVPDTNIIVVGASLGAYIALESSILNNNENIRFVLLGLCSAYALEYFQSFQRDFSGKFLSIYESSDSKGSCQRIFEGLQGHSSFQEIKLDMGIDHAFLYKPYPDWVNPLVFWIEE